MLSTAISCRRGSWSAGRADGGWSPAGPTAVPPTAAGTAAPARHRNPAGRPTPTYGKTGSCRTCRPSGSGSPPPAARGRAPRCSPGNAERPHQTEVRGGRGSMLPGEPEAGTNKVSEAGHKPFPHMHSRWSATWIWIQRQHAARVSEDKQRRCSPSGHARRAPAHTGRKETGATGSRYAAGDHTRSPAGWTPRRTDDS